MTTPLYFGSSRRPLFGIYHPPAGGERRSSAVVICPPIGNEYMRTHRALRTLAVQLARSGHGVLRFDWSGTGDSSGEPEHARVAAWLEDLASAVDEAQELVASSTASVVGLRLGATLAAVAAAECEMDALVLWDPVISGLAWLREQASQPGGSHDGPAPDQTLSLLGFPMTRVLWDDIATLDLLAPRPCRARRVVLVVGDEEAASRAFQDRVQGSGVRVTARYIPREGDWDAMDRLGAALLPGKVLNAIGEELE